MLKVGIVLGQILVVGEVGQTVLEEAVAGVVEDALRLLLEQLQRVEGRRGGVGAPVGEGVAIALGQERSLLLTFCGAGGRGRNQPASLHIDRSTQKDCKKWGSWGM